MLFASLATLCCTVVPALDSIDDYEFGLNLPTMSGTSGTGAFLPGVYNFSYSNAQLDKMVSLGFNSVRIPINLETANNSAALAQIRRIVTAMGGRAMLCMFETGSTVTHGTGRVTDVPLAIGAWTRVHTVFADLPRVRYEIFNEPHGYSAGCNTPPCGTAEVLYLYTCMYMGNCTALYYC